MKMKDVTKFIKVFVLLIASYFVFAVLSCLLPDKTIKARNRRQAWLRRAVIRMPSLPGTSVKWITSLMR